MSRYKVKVTSLFSREDEVYVNSNLSEQELRNVINTIIEGKNNWDLIRLVGALNKVEGIKVEGGNYGKFKIDMFNADNIESLENVIDMSEVVARIYGKARLINSVDGCRYLGVTEKDVKAVIEELGL